MATKAEAARLNGKKGGRPRKDANKPTSTPPVANAAETQRALETEPKTVENPFGLTPKELLFVTAYCGAANFNASEAYRLAGFEGKPASVTANAARLIAKDRISKAIAAKLAVRIERLEAMDGDEALRRISRFARADIAQVLGPDDPLSQLPAEVRATIKAVRPSRYGRTIELYDALRANELVAKASGKLRELHDVRVTRGIEDILAEVNDLEKQQRAQAS